MSGTWVCKTYRRLFPPRERPCSPESTESSALPKKTESLLQPRIAEPIEFHYKYENGYRNGEYIYPNINVCETDRGLKIELEWGEAIDGVCVFLVSEDKTWAKLEEQAVVFSGSGKNTASFIFSKAALEAGVSYEVAVVTLDKTETGWVQHLPKRINFVASKPYGPSKKSVEADTVSPLPETPQSQVAKEPRIRYAQITESKGIGGNVKILLLPQGGVEIRLNLNQEVRLELKQGSRNVEIHTREDGVITADCRLGSKYKLLLKDPSSSKRLGFVDFKVRS